MIGDLVAGRGLDKDWMSLDDMDRDMVRAAIGAEDSKFCQHNGFDFEAIEDAMKRNASGGRIRGGSTISQQTAKNAVPVARRRLSAEGSGSLFHLPDRAPLGQAADHGGLSRISPKPGLAPTAPTPASQRYFGHDASAMSATEAARIAAILPLPKKRGAIAPKGFTRRYGNTIAARIGQVRRDGLDACVYAGTTAPKDKAPPPSKAPRELPGRGI